MARIPFFKFHVSSGSGRIPSLDQFRGFTVISMILVNFLGDFECMPWTFKHHREGLSFADTVAPSFLFAVGIGFRMTFMRALKTLGMRGACWAAIRRYIILIILGTLVYSEGFDMSDPMGSIRDVLRCDMWDALVDIGFCGLLALPFIFRGVKTRALAGIGFLVFYQILYSVFGYGKWVMARSIDGGPLGPLSWVFPLLMGSLVYDGLQGLKPKDAVKSGLGLGVLLVAIGAGLSLLWPFSQRGMTTSYAVVSSGISFLLYVVIYLFADVKGWNVPVFRTFGKNPLFLYLFYYPIEYTVGRLFHDDASVAVAVSGFLLVAGISYAAGLFLERKNLYFRL